MKHSVQALPWFCVNPQQTIMLRSRFIPYRSSKYEGELSKSGTIMYQRVTYHIIVALVHCPGVIELVANHYPSVHGFYPYPEQFLC